MLVFVLCDVPFPLRERPGGAQGFRPFALISEDQGEELRGGTDDTVINHHLSQNVGISQEF